MANNESNVLMITEDDIEQLLIERANAPVWEKAHLPTKHPAYRYVKRPTHRYEGELLIDGENLVFNGRDIKDERDYKLELPLDDITDVYLKFSERLTNSSDFASDISNPMPFVVRYQDNGKSETLYFTTSLNNNLAHGYSNNFKRIHSNNFKWYITLGKIVTKNRRLQLFNPQNLALVMA